MKAWYELLSGHLSVPVYRIDAPASEEEAYVLVRPESETDSSNNARFVSQPVVIVEIITRQDTMSNDEDAGSIEGEILGLAFPRPGVSGLPAQAGIQITGITRQTTTDIVEDTGSGRVYRRITRIIHRVAQLETV